MGPYSIAFAFLTEPRLEGLFFFLNSVLRRPPLYVQSWTEPGLGNNCIRIEKRSSYP